ncbi:MAG: hypothetical protein VXW87_02640 [Pseudomonadota bacterium]|nr:hypothetical protein [Pseudomonadota bacterium]
MRQDKDLSRFIFNINVKPSIQSMMFRLFVLAHSELEACPSKKDNLVVLRDVLPLMTIEESIFSDFKRFIHQLVLNKISQYLHERNTQLLLGVLEGDAAMIFDADSIDLSKTLRLCGGARSADLGGRYIKFGIITNRVLCASGGRIKKSRSKTTYSIESRYWPLVKNKPKDYKRMLVALSSELGCYIVFSQNMQKILIHHNSNHFISRYIAKKYLDIFFQTLHRSSIRTVWYVLNQHMMTLLHQYLFLSLEHSNNSVLQIFGRRARVTLAKCLKMQLPIYNMEIHIISEIVVEEIKRFVSHCQSTPELDYTPKFYSRDSSQGYVNAILAESNKVIGTFCQSPLNQFQQTMAIIHYAQIHGEPQIEFERNIMLSLLRQPTVYFMPTKYALNFIATGIRQGLSSMLSDYFTYWVKRGIDWPKVFKVLQSVTSDYIKFSHRTTCLLSCSFKNVELVPLFRIKVPKNQVTSAKQPLITMESMM